MFNTGSNTWPNIATLRDTATQNENNLDLPKSFKVKCDGVNRLPIYGFLLTSLMFNSTIGSILAPLRDIRPCNLSDLKFDLLGSPNFKFDSAIRLPIYGFLLMFHYNFHSNIVSN